MIIHSIGTHDLYFKINIGFYFDCGFHSTAFCNSWGPIHGIPNCP